MENEDDSQIEDYRDIGQEEKTKHFNNELNKLAIFYKLQKLNLNEVMMDFDASNSHPSAIWDENSVYPKMESGFVFQPHMNKIFVNAFNNQTFHEHGNESTILRVKYYNRPDLIFQHLPVEGKIENIEVNRKRNGYTIDTLTSVDICEIVKIDGKVVPV